MIFTFFPGKNCDSHLNNQKGMLLDINFKLRKHFSFLNYTLKDKRKGWVEKKSDVLKTCMKENKFETHYFFRQKTFFFFQVVNYNLTISILIYEIIEISTIKSFKENFLNYIKKFTQSFFEGFCHLILIKYRLRKILWVI